MSPPQIVSNPPIARRLRDTQSVGAGGVVFNISARFLALSDAKEYLGTSTPVIARYAKLRMVRVEVWLANLTASTGVTPTLTVTDLTSGTDLRDTGGLGVDFAHVAMRLCLGARQTWVLTSSTSTVVSVEVPPTAGFVGSLISDITFEGA